MFAGTVKAESLHSTSQMPDGTRCNFRILIFCEYFDSIFALPVRRSTEKERRVGNEPTYRLFFEAISDAHRCFRLWEQTFGGDASSVAPIEGIQLRIRVLELKRQFVSCADAARHRVTHFGLLVFE